MRFSSVKKRPGRDVQQEVIDIHFNDPNYDFDDNYSNIVTVGGSIDLSALPNTSETVPDVEAALSSSQSDLKENNESHEYKSPYPEVRAAVLDTDDCALPVGTFRVWILGTLLTAILSSVNQVLAMRNPGVSVSGFVALLLAFPCGKVLEYTLPTTRFRTLGVSWTLNPGTFNVKEHTLIAVMATVGAYGAYATDVIATQKIYFNQQPSLTYQIILCLSSQVVGFGWAGLLRRILVWQSSMLWPNALVTSALLNVLHDDITTYYRKGPSRIRFFLFTLMGCFFWYWFPGYIFTALSVFSWVCWIAPKNVLVNQIFGYNSGFGLGVMTFDWSLIAFNGSPLVTPWWAQANMLVSFLLGVWVVAPALYYSNTFYSKYLPVSAPYSFDNTGMPYNASAIIRDGLFDAELYKSYSPLFLPVTMVVRYMADFAGLAAILVHTCLWHRHDILRHLRSPMKDRTDVHSRLMSSYLEVPEWWYAILESLAFILAAITVKVYDTQLPVLGLILALTIGFVFVIPGGIMLAITNQTIQVNVLSEVIAGYVLPGRPVALMIFKTFSTASSSQATQFSADLKLGHYMKIPPRLMFSAQLIASVLSALTAVLVQSAMFANIPDMCTPHQPHRFTCPSTHAFSNAAVIWGAVGPKRFFSPGALYHSVVYGFPIGALLPIPFYFAAKRFPRSYIRYINIPVFFSVLANVAISSPVSIAAWLTVGVIFQWYMRRTHFFWWSRYNYILSAALDAGAALASVVIFLVLQLPRGGTISLSWWGNTVWQNTADYNGAPFHTLQPGETFGPKTWS
ncbi:glutathione transporter [Rickenella mellea]|uniref:Glutathione transporter n=1 Tax=Rickenella mellea TaxID=50990 RepID=A0A4Y7Q5B3_9AGAM|nr:glutathione transporter [Rickenella mellea]